MMDCPGGESGREMERIALLCSTEHGSDDSSVTPVLLQEGAHN